MRDYGYGIVDKNGDPISLVNTDQISGERELKRTVNRWNEKTQDSGTPFRVVKLFYVEMS